MCINSLNILSNYIKLTPIISIFKKIGNEPAILYKSFLIKKDDNGELYSKPCKLKIKY